MEFFSLPRLHSIKQPGWLSCLGAICPLRHPLTDFITLSPPPLLNPLPQQLQERPLYLIPSCTDIFPSRPHQVYQMALSALNYTLPRFTRNITCPSEAVSAPLFSISLKALFRGDLISWSCRKIGKATMPTTHRSQASIGLLTPISLTLYGNTIDFTSPRGRVSSQRSMSPMPSIVFIPSVSLDYTLLELLLFSPDHSIFVCTSAAKPCIRNYSSNSIVSFKVLSFWSLKFNKQITFLLYFYLPWEFISYV